MSYVYLNNKADFKKCIKILIDALTTNKDDKIKIFESIKLLAKNNLGYIDNELIYTNLSIDKNFLISEYRWNDLTYKANLLILQEYLLGTDLGSINIYLPHFFIKHFHYLANKYPNIFDKSIKDILSSNYYNIHIIKCAELGDNSGILYKSLEKNLMNVNLSDIIQNREKYNFHEIYFNIFSFLWLIANNTEELKLTSLVSNVKNSLDILNRINFKLYILGFSSHNVEENKTINEILKVNDFISNTFLSFLSVKLDNSNIHEQIEKVEIFNLFKLILDYKSENSLVEILNTFPENLKTEKLPKFSISQPKNNFQYECTNRGSKKSTPFFLKTVIKLKDLILDDSTNTQAIYTHILKNLQIIVNNKNYHIYYSDFKSQSTNYITINKIICLYITKSETYKLSASLRNPYLKQFEQIIKPYSAFDLPSKENNTIIFNIQNN
jgi:hypothetical protein